MSDREDDEPMTNNRHEEEELMDDEQYRTTADDDATIDAIANQELGYQEEYEEEDQSENMLPTIDIQHGPDETVTTFIFHNETHTLGNSLRHILMKNKKVDFCGYTVPHPLEDKMSLRLQTNGSNASKTLVEGMGDLMSITEHVMLVFNQRMKEHEADHMY